MMGAWAIVAIVALATGLAGRGPAGQMVVAEAHAPPTLTAFKRDGTAVDASDVLRIFGNLTRAEAVNLQVGSYALQEKRSLLGDLDLLPQSDTGDVACQGSMNAKPMLFFGDDDALNLARRWLLTVPIDADGQQLVPKHQ